MPIDPSSPQQSLPSPPLPLPTTSSLPSLPSPTLSSPTSPLPNLSSPPLLSPLPSVLSSPTSLPLCPVSGANKNFVPPILFYFFYFISSTSFSTLLFSSSIHNVFVKRKLAGNRANSSHQIPWGGEEGISTFYKLHPSLVFASCPDSSARLQRRLRVIFRETFNLPLLR